MKLLCILAGAVALTGCAANMQHPSKSLAERKLDRQHCSAESTASKVSECMAARGYAQVEVEPFPFGE
jgi:hypothetical protein